MKLTPKRHSIDSLFTFLLLLVFTMFTLMLSGMGAAVYKNSAAHLEENYTSRTAISYTAEKIRQHDRRDSIFLTELEGVPALALRDQIEGEAFITYIYFYDNSLCELMIRAAYEPSLALGTHLVSLSAFSVEQILTDSSADAQTSDFLFKIRAVSPEGNELSMIVNPMSL